MAIFLPIFLKRKFSSKDSCEANSIDPIALKFRVFLLYVDDCSRTEDCDPNAQCQYSSDEQRYVCKCNEGYEGNGFYCAEQQEEHQSNSISGIFKERNL